MLEDENNVYSESVNVSEIRERACAFVNNVDEASTYITK
jgi:hypothetical protein